MANNAEKHCFLSDAVVLGIIQNIVECRETHLNAWYFTAQ